MIIPTLVKREALDESMEVMYVCLRHFGTEFYHYSQILACKSKLTEIQGDFQSANNLYKTIGEKSVKSQS